MDGNLGMLTDNLILVVHVSCCKIYEDVDYKHYVN